MFEPNPAEFPGAGGNHPPDFRHVESWVFDLDNTLYAPETGVLTEGRTRIEQYARAHLGMNAETATRLRRAYYFEYGSSFMGFIRNHGADPEAYLAFVHDLDLSALAPDPRLTAAIARLPGRRFIFTNACVHHATRVVQKLAIAHLFENICDIRVCGYASKPQTLAYERMLARTNISARSTAMFEDSARNLAPAHALGMTTIWLRAEDAAAPHSHIHYQTADLRAFLDNIEVSQQ